MLALFLSLRLWKSKPGLIVVKAVSNETSELDLGDSGGVKKEPELDTEGGLSPGSDSRMFRVFLRVRSVGLWAGG